MTARYPSLPPMASLPDLFEYHPLGRSHLFALIQTVMRDPGAFTVGEREVIAAYVSALNSCGFCEDAHAMVAIAFGFEKDLIDHLMADLDAAPIEPRLKPVLRYCRKLTEAPRQVTDADAAAVYDAGWTEAHLHAAVMITGIFNLMNRLCEGAGLTLGKDMSVEDDEHAEFVRGLDIPNLIQYTGYVRSEPDR